MGKHNVKHKSMHQKKQIGIKDKRAGCLGVPVLGLGRVRWDFSEIRKQAKNKNTESIKTCFLPFLPFLLYFVLLFAFAVCFSFC